MHGETLRRNNFRTLHVKTIVESYEGRIELRGEGKGTTFEIYLRKWKEE